MQELIKIERAAEILGISPWTVRKLIAFNKLRSVKIGRRRLLEAPELQRLIDEGRDYQTVRPEDSRIERGGPQ